MNKDQAFSVLVQAIHKGQSKGVYTLEEAVLLADAIKLLTTPVKNDEVETEPVKAKK